MKKYMSAGVLLVAIFSLAIYVSNTMANVSLQETEFTVLHSGIFIAGGTFTSKGSKVLTTQDEYEAELRKYTSEPARDIDFSEHKVLLVDMGQRNTSGYSIDVTNVVEHPNAVKAAVTLTLPGRDCVVMDVLTNPYQFVSIRTQKEVLIDEALRVAICNESL